MTIEEFFKTTVSATTIAEIEGALETFELSNPTASWIPVGRENNRGTIEASADSGRSLVERLTNGIDAVIEAEHDAHRGVPDCRSRKTRLLPSRIDEIFAQAYESGRDNALFVAELPDSAIPETPPWTFEQVIDDRFVPKRESLTGKRAATRLAQNKSGSVFRSVTIRRVVDGKLLAFFYVPECVETIGIIGSNIGR